MSNQIWVLVEWIGSEQSKISNYTVVKTVNNRKNLYVGNIVLLRNEDNVFQKAQVIRISDDKEFLHNFKMLLEKQKDSVKNFLSLYKSITNEISIDTKGMQHSDSDAHSSISKGNRRNRYLNGGPYKTSHDNRLWRNKFEERMRPPATSVLLPDTGSPTPIQVCNKGTQTEFPPSELDLKLDVVKSVINDLHGLFVIAFAQIGPENENSDNQRQGEINSDQVTSDSGIIAGTSCNKM